MKQPANLSSAERARLIARGNQCFNEKKYDLAGKIFKTASYQDGLIRMGDLYRGEKNFFRAIEFYRQARFLRGEYLSYISMGLVSNKLDFNDLIQRRQMDEVINKKLARAVQIMMARG
ncbi:MAG TPA: hypothetical protein DC049_18570 [Spirochaetia bacterium]|nr:hypothetical protein [Spirochaetia bacterium]